MQRDEVCCETADARHRLTLTLTLTLTLGEAADLCRRWFEQPDEVRLVHNGERFRYPRRQRRRRAACTMPCAGARGRMSVAG